MTNNEMTNFGSMSDEIGFVESLRLMSERRKAQAELQRFGARSVVEEVKAQTRHSQEVASSRRAAALRNQEVRQLSELTMAAESEVSEIYNRAVELADEDPGRAAFLFPTAVAGRDRITAIVRGR